jgi:flagellar hook-length control protein FliK
VTAPQAAVVTAAIALPTPTATTGAVTATPQAGVPTPAVPGGPADPQALALLAADAPPVDPAAAAAPAADGATPGKLEIPAELLDAKTGAHAGGEGKTFNKDGTPQRDLPPAPTLPPADTAPTTPTPPSAPTPAAASPADAGAGGAASPAPVPTIAQALPTATAQNAGWAGAGTAGAPQLTRGSAVQTAERVQELVRIATTRSGNARATLQLRPEALGQVDVHLRTSREGLVATIAAHDQAGLDALQQAGGELRRLLEDRGVQLHSLDLQLSADSEGFTHQRDARQAESGRGGAAVSYGLADDEDVVAEDELILTTAPSTSSSSLVDVTA